MSQTRSVRGIVAIRVALLSLAVGLPAAALVSVSSSNVLELRTGERVVQVRMSRGGLSGPRLQLRRTASGLRGNAYGLPVQLGWSAGRVAGQVGPDAVRLDVRQERQGMEVRGTFAGQASDLHVWPTTISGRIGWCGYSLVFAGDRYSGWRGCGSSAPIATTLRLPAAMGPPMPDAERAAVLAILLARE